MERALRRQACVVAACVWASVAGPVDSRHRESALSPASAPSVAGELLGPSADEGAWYPDPGVVQLPDAGAPQPPKPGTAAGSAAGQAVKPASTSGQPTKPPQTTTPAQAAKPQAAAPAKPGPAQAAAGRLVAMLFVTDPAGRPLEGVKASANGAVTREATSDREGVARLNALRAGTYRVRFESPQVVTFEREITLKAGPTAEFEITLNPVPPVAAPAAPAGVPVQPTHAPGPQPPVVRFAPTAASLPDWIERHYIGRNDPSAEGLVGEAAGGTAYVLQVKDPLPDRARPDADQFFYVVAGDGTARVGDRQEAITAGWFVVVPRGTPASFERRGRNPLILLVVVAPGR